MDTAKTFHKGKKPNPQQPNEIDDLDSAVQDIVNRSDSKQKSMIDVLKDLVRVFHDDQTKTISNRNVKIVDELCRVHRKELVNSLKKGDFNEQIAELLDLFETDESKSQILNSISGRLGITKADIIDYITDSIDDVVKDISEQTTTKKKGPSSEKNKTITKDQFYEKAFDEKVGKVYYDNIGRFCNNRIRDRIKFRTQQLSKNGNLFPKSLVNLNDKLTKAKKEGLVKKAIKSGVVSSIIGKLKNKEPENVSISGTDAKDDETKTKSALGTFWGDVNTGFTSTYSFITGHLEGFWKKFPKNLVKIGKKVIKAGFFGLVRVFCLPAFMIVKTASVLFGVFSGLFKVVLGCFGAIYNGIAKLVSYPVKLVKWVGGKFMKGFNLLAKGIKKILNTSVVKSLVKFIFTPMGAFVTGYIAGFLYKIVIKPVIDKWGDIKEFAEQAWSFLRESQLRLLLKGNKTVLSLTEKYNNFVNQMNDPTTPIGSIVDQFRKNGTKAGLTQSWNLFKKNVLWKIKDAASALREWFCSVNGPAALALGTAGSFVGGLIGSFVAPGVGTIIGSVLGGLVGGLVGSAVTKNFYDPLEQSIDEKKEILNRNQLYMDLYGGRQTSNLLDSALRNASEEDMKNSAEYAKMKRKKEAIDALDVQRARTKAVDENGKEVERDVDMDSFVREQEKKSDRFLEDGAEGDRVKNIQKFMSGLLLRRRINQYKSNLMSAQNFVDYCNRFDDSGNVPKECLDEYMGYAISVEKWHRPGEDNDDNATQDYHDEHTYTSEKDPNASTTVPSTVESIIKHYYDNWGGQRGQKYTMGVGLKTTSVQNKWLSAKGMKSILWKQNGSEEGQSTPNDVDQEFSTNNAKTFVDSFFKDEHLKSIIPDEWTKDNEDGRMSKNEYEGKKNELFSRARFLAYSNALAHGYTTQDDANRLISYMKDAFAPETDFESKSVKDGNPLIRGFENMKPVSQESMDAMRKNIGDMERELDDISKKNEEIRKRKAAEKKEQIGVVRKMKDKLRKKTESLNKKDERVVVWNVPRGDGQEMSANAPQNQDRPKMKVSKRV